ncbi:recombinase family protein [Pseudomonas sp. BO3-4]|uniref:recombinase family protein n=1 Tax=Pseudomonas sp. BO3-4 TaxID=3094916 RepID=UPI002A5B019F|nr:recombinase family protein [Pseudomonas sp. BO3-4]WPO31606.1 recombinase family protein [Pseudomonas sp. BO3-4]
MPQAISYVRFSSVRQHGGTSVERQTAMIADWLKNNPTFWLSSLKFQDLAKSGYHGDHIKEGGGFAKLLAAVKAGAIKEGDVVLVEAIDRTGRMDTVDMLGILTPILQAGVSIITLNDGNVYNRTSVNGSHIYMLVAQIQAANQYSENLSRRTKASYRIREERAKSGEQVKRWTPVWLTTDGAVIERIAKHVKAAFELYTAGVGKATIGVRMRETGEPELATCSGPTVEGWLRNKTAIGYWNDIPNAYPPIIEPELFILAQQRGKDAKTKRPAKTAKHFLVGLVKCGHCGGNYIMQNKEGRPHSMRCLNRQRLKDAGCDNTRTIPKPVLDHIRVNTSLAAVEAAFQRQQLTVNQKRILAIQGELDAVGQKITTLVKLADAAGDLDEITAQLKVLKAEREALNAELILMERTESPVDTLGAVKVEDDLLENDSVKLAALLKGVGYAINVFVDGRMTVDWPDEEGLEWAYKGVDRSTGHYLLRNYDTGAMPETYDKVTGLQIKPMDEMIRVFPKPHLVPKVVTPIDDGLEISPLLPFLRRKNKHQP